MSGLVTVQSGNLMSAPTWGVCASVANAFVDSQASGLTLTASSFTDTSTFVLDPIALSRFGIKINQWITPTGTLTLKLRNVTTSTDVAAVVINCSDFPFINQDGTHGWVIVPVSHTPNGVDSYLIRVTRSVIDTASNRIVIFSSSSTTTTASRLVVLSTTATPTAADQLIFAGSYTGAGTSNSYTITWNDTSATAFGSTSMAQSISVNSKATLDFTTSSAALTAKWQGLFRVYSGGSITGAITGTGTLDMLMNSATNVDSGFDLVGTGSCTLSGISRAPRRVRLTATATAGVTTQLTVSDTSGMRAGDTLVFTPTGATYSENETKVIFTVDSSTQVTLATGLTYTHIGTTNADGDIRGYVGVLTSNVKMHGAATSLCGYVNIGSSATCSFTDVEFYNLGSSTGSKRGIDIQVATSSRGPVTLNRCSIRNFEASGLIPLGVNITGTSGTNAITIQNSVFYSCTQGAFNNSAAGSGFTLSGNLFVGGPNNNTNAYVLIQDVRGTYDDNVICGVRQSSDTASGVSIAGSGNITFTNNVICGNAGGGLAITASGLYGTISGNSIYRNASAGIHFNGVTNGSTSNPLTFSNNTLFGNGSVNSPRGQITFAGSNPGNLIFSGGSINAGTTITYATYGIVFLSMSRGPDVLFKSSVAMGTTTPFTNLFGDGSVTELQDANVLVVGCSVSATNLVQSTLVGKLYRGLRASPARIAFIGCTGVTEANKAYILNGVCTQDDTIYRTAAPSSRLTPTTSAAKGESGRFAVPIASGGTVTVSVWVRRSVVGDGAAYNGNSPRLIQRANPQIGVATNTVLATLGAGTGTWIQLTGTTAAATSNGQAEFVVDYDGTTGWINVDDWSSSNGLNRTQTYWNEGLPIVGADSGGAYNPFVCPTFGIGI